MTWQEFWRQCWVDAPTYARFRLVTLTAALAALAVALIDLVTHLWLSFAYSMAELLSWLLGR